MTTLLFFYVGAAILLILLALPLLLERIGPNPIYGFRVAATRADPKLWYAVNKFAAKQLIEVGVAVAVASVALYACPGMTLDVYALSCLSVFLVAFVPAIARCVRYLKSFDGN